MDQKQQDMIIDCIQKGHYISMAGQQLVESRLPVKPNYPNSIKIDLFERIEKDKISRLAIIFYDSQSAQEWYSQVNLPDAPIHVHRKVSIYANVVFVITDGSKQITVYVDFIKEFIRPKPLSKRYLQSLLMVVHENYGNQLFYYHINWEFKGFINTFESIEQPPQYPEINRQYISQFGNVQSSRPKINQEIILESSSDEFIPEKNYIIKIDEEKKEKKIKRVNSQKNQIIMKQEKKQKALLHNYLPENQEIYDLEILI
ncbi:hypothetical protein pb186bvf_011823 [Paramecium bursaria]